MFPGSARVAVVNSSTSDGNSSAYLARTGCLTTTKIIRTSSVRALDDWVASHGRIERRAHSSSRSGWTVTIHS